MILAYIIILFIYFGKSQIDKIKSTTVLDEDIYHCFTFSYSGGSFGCSSSYWGTRGEIYLIKNLTDVRTILSLDDNSKYVILFYPEMFTLKIIKSLELRNKIAGAILLWNEDLISSRPNNASFEDSCPFTRFEYYKDSAEYGNCKKVVWNPYGQNLIERRYDYPMALLKNKDKINTLLECARNNSMKHYPKCGINFNTVMASYEQSTPICMRRSKIKEIIDGTRFCYPLSAQNIYSPLRIYKNTNFSRKYIVVSTKLDTRSLFINSNVGANSEVSAIIVFLSMIKTISKILKDTDYFGKDINILFVGFDGEAYDFIGSSRMAYDMSLKKFSIVKPFDANNISYWIDIGSLMLTSRSYWLHTDPIVFDGDRHIKEQVKKLSDTVKYNFFKQGLAANFVPLQAKLPLPPSSLQQFLAHKLLFPGIYLSDYFSEFKNKYFDGYLDDAKNVNVSNEISNQKAIQDLALVSSALVQTILELSGGKNKFIGLVNTSVDDVSELAYCLLKESNCSLFRMVLTNESQASLLSKHILDRHCALEGTQNSFAQVISSYIAYTLGEKFPLDSDECAKTHFDNEMFNFKLDDQCVKNAPVYAPISLSPYFDDKESYLEGYSSWAASNFATLIVEIYYIASPSMNIQSIVVGIFVTLISIIVVVVIRKKTNLIFE